MPRTPVLLCVHAHPDDESSKGSATVARYSSVGVRTILVCATNGEEGDILNPSVTPEEIGGDMAAFRLRELAQAAAIIGYSEVITLGYRDSGMPESDANADPRSFWQTPIADSTAKVVEILRRERPDVVVTYGEDQSGYPHPDHLRVHDVTVEAFALAADASYGADLGPVHQVAKLYYDVFSKRKLLAIVAAFESNGMESPLPKERLERDGQDHLITTEVDISGFLGVQQKALMAHRSQIDPDSKFWFGLSEFQREEAHPVDEFMLAKVAPELETYRQQFSTSSRELDLFGGVDLGL